MQRPLFPRKPSNQTIVQRVQIASSTSSTPTSTSASTSGPTNLKDQMVQVQNTLDKNVLPSLDYLKSATQKITQNSEGNVLLNTYSNASTLTALKLILEKLDHLESQIKKLTELTVSKALTTSVPVSVSAPTVTVPTSEVANNQTEVADLLKIN